MTCKAKNLNGYTDSTLLNLTLQKSLILDGNSDLDTWHINEDPTTSSLDFDRVLSDGTITTPMSVDTNGNVSFTSLVLGGDLDMDSNSIISVNELSGRDDLSFTIFSRGNNGGEGLYLQNQALTGTENAEIFIGNDSSVAGLLTFSTAETVGGGVNERMRIENDGKVGIGTNNVNNELVLYGDTTPSFQIRNSSVGSGSSDGFVITLNGSDVEMSQGSSTRFTIDDDNTTFNAVSSGGGLILNQIFSLPTYFTMTNLSSTNGSRIGLDSNENFEIRERDGNDIIFYTNDTQVMSIDSSGQIDMNYINKYSYRYDFSFNPSTTSTIYTQYLGTYQVYSTIEIYLRDNGNSHGSGNFFRVTRDFNELPIVHIQNNGLSTGTGYYTINYRLIDNDSYELFFTTSSTINATITYIATINAEGQARETNTLSASNDTSINSCVYALTTIEDGKTGIGTNNPIYTLDVEGVVNSEVPYNIRTTGTSTQTISNNTATAVSFGSSPYGKDTEDDFSVSSTVYTADKDGLYYVSYTLTFDSDATGLRQGWISIDGDNNNRFGYIVTDANSNGITVINGSALVPLEATETFSIIVHQTSGGDLDIGGNNNRRNRLDFYRIGNI